MWRRVVFGAAACLLAVGAFAAEPPHLALVVGNANYQSLPPAPGCQLSGAALAGNLRRRGWDVTELRDPSNGQLSAAIIRFSDRLAAQPGAVALMYLCGYAAGFEGRTFLLPASARLQRPTDVLTEGIVARALTGSVARANLSAGVIALDLVALPQGEPVALESVGLRTRSRAVGLVAATGQPTDTNGAIAYDLIDALSEPSLTVATLLDTLSRRLNRPFTQAPENEAFLIGAPQAPAPATAVAATGPASPAEVPAPREVAPLMTEPALAPANPVGPEPTVAEAAMPDQTVPAPAPTSPLPAVAVPVAQPPRASDAPGNDRRDGAEQGSAPATLGDLDRRRVQLALQRLGYYAGRVDGVLGPDSLAAIRRYQHELGMDMDGRLTKTQASRLLAIP